MNAGGERRTDRRLRVEGAFVRLLSREAAHIQDVSAGGALLETSAAAAPGSGGRLEARLNGLPFTAAVTVTHVRPQNGTDGKARIGVAFGAMDEDSRHALSRFLGPQSGSQA